MHWRAAKAQFVNELRGEAKKEAVRAVENVIGIYGMVKVEALVQTDRLVLMAVEGLNSVHKRLLHKIKEELPKNRRHIEQAQAEA